MLNKQTISKAVRTFSAVAILIGAAGCAAQGGGTKAYDEVIVNSQPLVETVEVCRQFGARMECETIEKHVAEQNQAYWLETQGYSR